MLEKIKHKFLNDGTLFRQQERGEYVFYPWGYPGEGVFVNKKQHHRISFFVNAYGFLGFLYCVLGILLQELNVISYITGYYGFLILAMGVVPLYVFAMYIIKRGKKFLIVPKKERVYKKKFLWMLLISIFQIEGFLLYANKVPIIFLTIYSLSFIFTLYVFVKIIRTRGYYFTG